jgi:hypothetical protein
MRTTPRTAPHCTAPHLTPASPQSQEEVVLHARDFVDPTVVFQTPGECVTGWACAGSRTCQPFLVTPTTRALRWSHHDLVWLSL